MKMIKSLLLNAKSIACKGGKGGSAPAPEPMVAPTPPVDEASVQLDDKTSDKKKLKTGKKSLKLGKVTTAPTTGLNL